MTPPPGPPLLQTRHAYRWTSALADILTGLRRRFEGDLDLYLLVMVFVQAEMEPIANARDRPVGLNALSVAAACGIPRETTRLKLQRLVAAGWLRTRPDGLHYLADKTDRAEEYGRLGKIAAPALSARAAA